MNIIQYYNGILPPHCVKAMRSVLEHKPENVKHIFESCNTPSNIDLRAEADLFRLNWLLKHPDDLWLDCDVTVKYWPSFIDNGKPYFGHSCGLIDVWAIAPMGHTEVLKELQKMPYKQLPSGAWCGWLEKHLSDINLIPKGYFFHH